MSEIEWSPDIKFSGGEEIPPEIMGVPCCIKESSDWLLGNERKTAEFWTWNSNITHYRIPMEDYRRITGMPSWDDAPEWADRLGQNRGGQWFFMRGPASPAGEEGIVWFECVRSGQEAGVGDVLGDWRDTLQERPAKPDIEPDTILQYEPDDVAFSAHSEEPMTGHDTVKPPAAASFLEAALGHMQDRASTYDAPEGERSMGKTVAAFNAVTEHQLSEEQGWLFMVILKAVRTQQGGYRGDNYEDGAAYFGLQGEAAARDRS